VLEIDNDGGHDSKLVDSRRITVDEGVYPFRVEYFNNLNPGELKVWWTGENVEDRGIIPAKYFSRDPEMVEPPYLGSPDVDEPVLDDDD